jgi:hypothetical protein
MRWSFLKARCAKLRRKEVKIMQLKTGLSKYQEQINCLNDVMPPYRFDANFCSNIEPLIKVGRCSYNASRH